MDGSVIMKPQDKILTVSLGLVNRPNIPTGVFDSPEEALECLERAAGKETDTIDRIFTITLECEENRFIHSHSMEPNERYEVEISYDQLKDLVN
jgi:hypothetical protein